MPYENDPYLQDIQDDMYAAREEKQQPVAKVDQRSKFAIGLFAGLIIILYMYDKITLNQAIIIGIVGLVILYLMKDTNQKKELTWLECMMRINDLLTFLQKHPIGKFQQVPPGEVRVSPIGRKQWYEGHSFKRSFKVTLYDSEVDNEETYFAEIDVFTGDLITFRHAPEGVTGGETKDVKYIPPAGMVLDRKRQEYLGKSHRNNP